MGIRLNQVEQCRCWRWRESRESKWRTRGKIMNRMILVNVQRVIHIDL